MLNKNVFWAVMLEVTLFWLAGCASNPVNPVELRESRVAYDALRKELLQSETIAPGNTLMIEHEGDSKISGVYKVDFDGQIRLPYHVILKASGIKAPELAKQIQRAYQAFVKVSSQVRVEIKERNALIEVRGEVKTPGRYLVRLDMPLEEIIAKAGGLGIAKAEGAVSANQRPDYLRIERPISDSSSSSGDSVDSVKKDEHWFKLSDYFFRYDTEPSFLWHGGETLYFQMTAPETADFKKSWNTITMMGEVREPKELPVLPNSDLLTYISRSGGLSSAADPTRVDIIRRSQDQHLTTNLLRRQPFNELRAGDVVVIRAVDNSPTVLDKVMSYAATMSTVTVAVVALILL